MIAAGAVIQAGVRVPSGQVWAGSPATFLRDLTAVEKENIREQHHEYCKLAEIHAERRQTLNKIPRSQSESTSTKEISKL